MNQHEAEHMDAVMAFARQWTMSNQERLAKLSPAERSQALMDGIRARFYEIYSFQEGELDIVDHLVQHTLADLPVR